jgi:hypothetical protein
MIDYADIWDDGWRESPSVPSPSFDGHDTPSSVFTDKTTDTPTDSHTSWIPSRRELRIFVVAGCVGQFVSPADLKDSLGRARAAHGRVDFISLVLAQADYAAHCPGSANLRNFLSRQGFRRIDSYNGHGLLFEKSLCLVPETLQTPEAPEVASPRTPASSVAEECDRLRSQGLKTVPMITQRHLAHEKLLQDRKHDGYAELARINDLITELETKEKTRLEKLNGVDIT